MVAVLRHLLDMKLPSVVLPLGRTKLYQAVMTALSKYGALEGEYRVFTVYFYIASVCRLEMNLSHVHICIGNVKKRNEYEVI
jgi:hypothetical protein